MISADLGPQLEAFFTKLSRTGGITPRARFPHLRRACSATSGEQA